MATRTATTSTSNTGVGERSVVTWAGLLNGDDGSAVEAWDFPDRSIQVIGTLGTGGQVTWQGSNDGTNWATLTDLAGANLVITALGVKMPAPITRYVRPLVAGDGSTNLTVVLFCRR